VRRSTRQKLNRPLRSMGRQLQGSPRNLPRSQAAMQAGGASSPGTGRSGRDRLAAPMAVRKNYRSPGPTHAQFCVVLLPPGAIGDWQSGSGNCGNPSSHPGSAAGGAGSRSDHHAANTSQATAKICRSCPRCVPTKKKGPALSGQPLDFIGGAKRDRTVDLYNAIVALTGCVWRL
jgi:hypothetical protein